MANTGGALYLGDIAKLLDIKYLKCSRDIRKLEVEGMGLIDHEIQADNQKVILLTERGWRYFGKNRDRCLCKKDDLRRNSYKAFMYIKMAEQRENHKKYTEEVLNKVVGEKDLQGIYKNSWTSILKNQKFMINKIEKRINEKDFDMERNIDLIYCTTAIYNNQLVEYMEIFYRLFDYIYMNEKIRINLEIISMSRPNIGVIIDRINRKKVKEIMYITNEQRGTKKIKNVFQKVYRKRIKFYVIDKDFNLKLY